MPEPINPVSMVVTELHPDLVRIADLIGIIDPPAMVRLEPDSVTGDPAPGAEARIADAAWMLGRQWQLGELTGENAGTVVGVEVSSRALPITGWAPLDDESVDLDDAPWRAWPEGALLEELVQDVSGFGREPGLRQSAEAGAQLVDLLLEAGEDDLASAVTAAHPLSLPPEPVDPSGALDPQGPRLLRVLGGAFPDGAAVLAALQAGDPPWLAGASADARAVLAGWRTWMTGAPESGGAWSTERLEYRFGLRFGGERDGGPAYFRATQFGSAQVRWSDLEWMPAAAPETPADAPPGTPVDTVATMLATPLRYPGMPADRYWQLEDGRVDLNAIEAQPTDLARLCLAEFAMTSGDDWLGVPVDGLLGAANQVRSVELIDNYGERTVSPALDDPGFTMYGVSSSSGARYPGLVLPPVADGLLVGEAVEEILFLRDEMANMAWAIEQTVVAPSGTPRSRSSEPPPQPDPWPASLTPEERVYRLQTAVPAHWIPLLPVSLTPGQVSLRKGALLRDDVPVEPIGVTLQPTPLTFPGEELPREGVALRAVPVLARRADGTYVRWTAYRVRTGRGEAASRLAWDSALAITDLRH